MNKRAILLVEIVVVMTVFMIVMAGAYEVLALQLKYIMKFQKEAALHQEAVVILKHLNKYLKDASCVNFEDISDTLTVYFVTGSTDISQKGHILICKVTNPGPQETVTPLKSFGDADELAEGGQPIAAGKDEIGRYVLDDSVLEYNDQPISSSLVEVFDFYCEKDTTKQQSADMVLFKISFKLRNSNISNPETLEVAPITISCRLPLLVSSTPYQKGDLLMALLDPYSQDAGNQIRCLGNLNKDLNVGSEGYINFVDVLGYEFDGTYIAPNFSPFLPIIDVRGGYDLDFNTQRLGDNKYSEFSTDWKIKVNDSSMTLSSLTLEGFRFPDSSSPIFFYLDTEYPATADKIIIRKNIFENILTHNIDITLGISTPDIQIRDNIFNSQFTAQAKKNIYLSTSGNSTIAITNLYIGNNEFNPGQTPNTCIQIEDAILVNGVIDLNSFNLVADNACAIYYYDAPPATQNLDIINNDFNGNGGTTAAVNVSENNLDRLIMRNNIINNTVCHLKGKEIIVDKNTFVNGDETFVVINDTMVDYVTISNNLFFGSSMVLGSNTTGGLENFVIRNNIMSGNLLLGMRFSAGISTDSVIINNTIVDHIERGIDKGENISSVMNSIIRGGYVQQIDGEPPVTYCNISDINYIVEGTNNIDEDPSFKRALWQGQTWSENPSYDEEADATTLVDDAASWTASDFSGMVINPNTLAAETFYFIILDNTSTAITVKGDVTQNTSLGCSYDIFDFRLQNSSTSIDKGYSGASGEYNDPDGSLNDIGAYGGPGAFDPIGARR